MDCRFHAPTLSFPVPGTLRVEPTESESRHELDRFIEAMVAIRAESRAESRAEIRAEIRAVEEGRMDRNDNPQKSAPHTATRVMAETWAHDCSRETAAFRVASLKR